MITDASIDSRLEDSLLKIKVSRTDEQIRAYLLPYGYDEPQYTAGKDLYDAAFNLHQENKRELKEQMESTEQFNVGFEELYAFYMRDLSVARVAFKENFAMQRRLDAVGSRKSTYTGLVGQIRTFYNTVSTDTSAAEGMARYGRTAELLQANIAKLNGVAELKKNQICESAEAQLATEKRDEALENLSAWISDLISIARVALADELQLLEKLNIKVSS